MNQQLQSPLFRLPPELREVIYTYVLISSDPIEDLIIKTNPISSLVLPTLGRALLWTCKRVNKEIDLRPFFSQNRFAFTSPSYAHEFMCDLKRAGKAELITELSFDLLDSLGLPPGSNSTNAQSDFQRTARFVEWDHYLTCAIRIECRDGTAPCTVHRREDRNTRCHLHDDMHFIEDVSPLRSLRVLVMDFVDLHRRLIHAELDPIPNISNRFLDMLESLVTRTTGVEIRIRLLNAEDKVVEGMVCAPTTNPAIGEGGDTKVGTRKATRRHVREMVNTIHLDVRKGIT